MMYEPQTRKWFFYIISSEFALDWKPFARWFALAELARSAFPNEHELRSADVNYFIYINAINNMPWKNRVFAVCEKFVLFSRI